MLVWKGKIVEKLNTPCPHGDYIVEFLCDKVSPFKLRVCGQLFVNRENNVVEIPMEFKDENERVYRPAVENTPFSHLVVQ